MIYINHKILGALMSLLIMIVTLSFISTLYAEESDSEGDVAVIDQLVEHLESGESTDLAPEIMPSELLEPETASAMQLAIKAYYDYRSKGFDHRQSVFQWQLLSSKIIFVIVIFLVCIGVYFSWVQFSAGMKGKAKEDSSSETTIEASATGIKVSSPVLGVIILVISLMFFYLYLVYVYPIEEIL